MEFWNFLFKAIDIVEAFKTFAPEILELTKLSVETAYTDLGFSIKFRNLEKN